MLRQRIVKLKTLDFGKGLGRGSAATIKAVQAFGQNGREIQFGVWDGASVPNTQTTAARAYALARVHDLRQSPDLSELHDRF